MKDGCKKAVWMGWCQWKSAGQQIGVNKLVITTTRDQWIATGHHGSWEHKAQWNSHRVFIVWLCGPSEPTCVIICSMKRHPTRSGPSVQTQPEGIIAWKLIVFICAVCNKAGDSRVSLLHISSHYAASVEDGSAGVAKIWNDGRWKRIRCFPLIQAWVYSQKFQENLMVFGGLPALGLALLGGLDLAMTGTRTLWLISVMSTW